MEKLSIEQLVAIDFETSGLDFYSPDFEVKSLSIARKRGSTYQAKFYDKPEDIREALELLAENKTPLVVYNVGFEFGVLSCNYPDLEFNIYCDVARLVQVNGEIPDEQGYSLKDAVRRLLPEMANYEDEIKEWVADNIPEAKRRWGRFISHAPRDILERYNNADTIATLKIYEMIDMKFNVEGYDWRSEHPLYMYMAKEVVKAKVRGIRVDRGSLLKYKESLEKEINDIDSKFLEEAAEPIMLAREFLKNKEQAKFKKKIVTELPEFNIMSKSHLSILFTNILKQEAVLFTPKLQPSFKKEHLHQWGHLGDVLSQRGKRVIVLNQVRSLLELSEKDGRWHQSLKVVGTSTGRLAGGN
jgi:DNA polymerase I-like protein with 3'-5' exonuclease and polymerase domains